MDSGSIVAVASQHLPRLSTFTAGFELSAVDGVEKTFDERREAELIANRFKTEHYEQVINSGDIAWVLPRVVAHLEDLRLGMSYPNYYITRLASKFVKVSLSGAGGDELYGGYPWRYYHASRSLDGEQYFREYYRFWQRLVPDADKPSLFTGGTWKQVGQRDSFQTFRRVFTFNDRLRYDTIEDHIANSLYFESKTFLAGLFLVGDKLSMANSLEERFPFMDNDLVEFAQRIPVAFKLGELERIKRIDENELDKFWKYYRDYDDGKAVLRQAMSRLLPGEVTTRRKQGFSSPEESWYRGENAGYVRELLLSPRAAFRDFIRRDYVERVVREHTEQRINHRLLLWSLLCFEWWCRIFLDGQPVS
jgi:asparagine synthase (glutamine-hydrolysing)